MVSVWFLYVSIYHMIIQASLYFILFCCGGKKYSYASRMHYHSVSVALKEYRQ